MYMKDNPNRDNYFVMIKGPRSDIIRDGPSGTMKLRYVAINTRGVDSTAAQRGNVRAAYEEEVNQVNSSLQAIGDKQRGDTGVDIVGLTAPRRFALKVRKR